MSYSISLGKEYEIDITYNYSKYYYTSFEEKGIREIYGMSGRVSIPVLERMINDITFAYTDADGAWKKNTKTITKTYSKETGEEIPTVIAILKYVPSEYDIIENEVEYSEGSTDDYWIATAANAIKPLQEMLNAARLYPDEIWEGD